MIAYSSMAAWCESCKRELPQQALLRSSFSGEELQLVGLPIDPDESRETLESYVLEHQPAYDLATKLTGEQRAELRDWLQRKTGSDGLPASVLVDANGHILRVRPRLPTVSELRAELLGRASSSN